MATAKDEVQSILNRLPENCTLEDVQYHIYVVEKINKGLARVVDEGSLSQAEVEGKLNKWITR